VLFFAVASIRQLVAEEPAERVTQVFVHCTHDTSDQSLLSSGGQASQKGFLACSLKNLCFSSCRGRHKKPQPQKLWTHSLSQSKTSTPTCQSTLEHCGSTKTCLPYNNF
jgi:hypothetical protein